MGEAQPRVRLHTGPEADLVPRLRQAEPGACEDLYARFGAPVHRYAASLLAGDQELAEEVVVATFTDAVRNINRFDSRRATLSTWLCGIARRKVTGELRRLGRRGSVPTSMQVPLSAVADVPGDGDIGPKLISQLDAQRIVIQLSSVLSQIEMEALMLHTAAELSAGEIARVVGRSERAVESLLHRAKRKAREWLVGHGA